MGQRIANIVHQKTVLFLWQLMPTSPKRRMPMPGSVPTPIKVRLIMKLGRTSAEQFSNVPKDTKKFLLNCPGVYPC